MKLQTILNPAGTEWAQFDNFGQLWTAQLGFTAANNITVSRTFVDLKEEIKVLVVFLIYQLFFQNIISGHIFLFLFSYIYLTW